MALKDEDFLLKNDKDLQEAMDRLGLELVEGDKVVEDPMDQFTEFDMSALEKPKEKVEKKKKKFFFF